MTLTLGSLFSGIGGLELGFERTGGFVTRWQVENDPYAVKVLEKHWPNVRRYGDITTLDSAELERVDVIVGGFPCQDVSVAGKGAGLDGARSGLWSEYIRIVRALRPRYVCVENVPGLFVRGFGRVLGDLAESGYDAEWTVLSAAGVGAPHLRLRVFLVAHTGNSGQWELFQQEQQPGGALASNIGRDGKAQLMAHTSGTGLAARRNGEGLSKPPSGGTPTGVERGSSPQEVVHSASARRETRLADTMGSRESVFGLRPAYSSWWAIEPDVGRVANGVSSRVDRLRCLGNAVVPQVAQYVAECILAHAQELTPTVAGHTEGQGQGG